MSTPSIIKSFLNGTKVEMENKLNSKKDPVEKERKEKIDEALKN